MISLALAHCARETSPSIVVRNVAGAAARLENYEGAFLRLFPCLLLSSGYASRDEQWPGKAQESFKPRLYTPRAVQLSAALSSRFEMARRERKRKHSATKARGTAATITRNQIASLLIVYKLGRPVYNCRYSHEIIKQDLKIAFCSDKNVTRCLKCHGKVRLSRGRKIRFAAL